MQALASVTAVPTTPAPAAVAVHTPPTLQAVAITPPQAMEPPQAGCSTEELRVWMIHIVKNMGKDLNLLEVSMAGAVNQVSQGLEEVTKTASDAKKDVGVFAAIKHMVTDVQLEARTEAINADLKAIKGQTQSFAEHLAGYLLRTEAVEKGFHEHVVNSFGKVEAEFADVRAVVQGVYDARTDEFEANASKASMQLQQQALQQRIARIEAEHVGYKSDLAEHQQNATLLTAQMQAVVQNMDTAVAAAAQLEVSRMGAPTPCHCIHVTELDGRVTAIEALMAARPTTGPAGGQGTAPRQDPWSAWSAGNPFPQRPGILKDPPGFTGSPVPGASATDAGRRPRVVNDLFPEMDLKDLNRIFDNKIATNVDFQYNGEKNGGKLKKKVRAYLVSQCSDIAPILDFAESLDDTPLTLERLQAESNTYRWMTELNLVKLGDKLWGWLSTALSDKARDCS